MGKIEKIKARQIIDSRGNPTIETTVILDNGISAKAGVPSGASTGSHESIELRDNDPLKFSGKSVYKAVSNVNTVLNDLLHQKSAEDQPEIDNLMIEKDGTEDKSVLGANSILSVSLAVSRTAALSAGKSLYDYLAGLYGERVAVPEVRPLFNVINGGLHAGGSVKFQEFFVIPQKEKFSENLEAGCVLYHKLKADLKAASYNTNIGDEGGFAPHFESNSAVLDFLKVETEGNFRLGLDVASSTFYGSGIYTPESTPLTAIAYLDYITAISGKYSLEILEDPLSEDDWQNWTFLTAKIGNKVKIIGDDLLVTNKTRLEKAVSQKAATGILIKLNQIGTLTETLEVIRLARKSGYSVIISHRSGETTDDYIADLAVGVGADYVKFGAPARGERVAKYNRLLEIYENIKR